MGIVIVTMMVCLIARIATAMAMVFPIAGTTARTTLTATDSKRQHRTLRVTWRQRGKHGGNQTVGNCAVSLGQLHKWLGLTRPPKRTDSSVRGKASASAHRVAQISSTSASCSSTLSRSIPKVLTETLMVTSVQCANFARVRGRLEQLEKLFSCRFYIVALPILINALHRSDPILVTHPGHAESCVLERTCACGIGVTGAISMAQII